MKMPEARTLGAMPVHIDTLKNHVDLAGNIVPSTHSTE